MVRAGLGVTVVPAGHRHVGVATPALVGFDLKRTLCLVRGGDAAGSRDAALPLLDALHAQFGADSTDACAM